MGDQVRRHQRAVAVAGDADAIAIDDARADGLVDRRLRVVDELLEVRVVGLLRIADDRERRVVDDRVAGEKQQAVVVEARELLLRAADLAGRRRARVVERVRVEDRRDARALLVAGRREQRERELRAVLALVLDEALLDRAHRGRGIREVRDGARRRSDRGLARFRRRERLAERAEHRVRRIRRRLVPRQERRGRSASANVRKYSSAVFSLRNRRSDLRVFRSKRSRNGRSPSGDAPSPREEDRVAVLPHDPLPVGQRAVDRLAGVLVALVARQSQRRRGLAAGSSTSTRNVRCQCLFSSYSWSSATPRRSRPVEADEALLGARDLGGRAGERRRQHHDLVARGNVDVPVAAVERLGPDERRGLGRAPLEVARSGRHAGDRHAIREGQLRERADPAAGAVPELHVVREVRVRGDVRVRLVNRRRRGGVSPSGEGSTSVMIAGLADRRDRARVRVDEGELAGRVVVEEVLVVLVRERVARLVGAALAGLAGRLLDARAVRRDRRRRRRPGVRRHELHEQRLLVGHPLQRAAQHRVQPRVAEAPDRTRSRRRRPTARRRPRGVPEREALPVGGPRDAVRAAAPAAASPGVSRLVATSTSVKRLRARRDPVAARRVVLAPRPRLDAHARELAGTAPRPARWADTRPTTRAGSGRPSGSRTASAATARAARRGRSAAACRSPIPQVPPRPRTRRGPQGV